MEDGEGREIDFKNNIIILTTNACTDQLMKLLRRSGDHAQPAGAGSGAEARAEQDLQAGFPGAHGRRPLLSRSETRR